ncbi:MAG: hypothetical protein ACSLFP_06695 [Acidimicrobiales bacterium]
MEKVVYLLWGSVDPVRGDELRDRLLADTSPALLALGARGLTVNVHDSAAAAAPSPAPPPAGEPAPLAQVSVWLDSYDKRTGVDDALAAHGLEVSGHLVTESLYDDYGTTPHAGLRTWPDGERSPGVLTVALVHRPADLDPHEWIERWHGVQSPASGRLQPRTRYVRNHVHRAVTPGAPQIDGIVEEGWPSAEHVAEPMLFFNAEGDPARMRAHVEEMMANVTACLDLARLRSITMSEHLMLTV